LREDILFQIRVQCQNCNYEKDLLWGISKAYYRLGNVIKDVGDKQKKEIQKILQNYNIHDSHNNRDLTYKKRVFRRRNCSGLFTRLHVRLKYNNDKTYRTEYKCPECESGLVQVKQIDIVKCPCPGCRKETLKNVGGILWY
jgi:hypothetical protein